MRATGGRDLVRGLVAHLRTGTVDPRPRPLWRVHLVVVRPRGACVPAGVLADRVQAVDPFVAVRAVGTDRLEVHLWVEAEDVAAASHLGLQVWADLAAGGDDPGGGGRLPHDGDASAVWDVVGLDVVRTLDLEGSTGERPAVESAVG